MLVDSINSRNFSKWAMIMGTIEGEWLKVDRDPETYEASLSALNERQEQGLPMDANFFRGFDLPVHP